MNNDDTQLDPGAAGLADEGIEIMPSSSHAADSDDDSGSSDYAGSDDSDSADEGELGMTPDSDDSSDLM